MCTVAIGNPKQHVHKASHCGRSNNEIMLEISLTIASSRYMYNGFILHAHPVRGESHNQRNATGEVATVQNCVQNVGFCTLCMLRVV